MSGRTRIFLSLGPRVAAFALFLNTTCLIASPVGSIAGLVKDPSAAVVAGVKLTLTNTSTNAKTVIASSSNGEFQFPQLAPATYSLQAEAAEWVLAGQSMFKTARS